MAAALGSCDTKPGACAVCNFAPTPPKVLDKFGKHEICGTCAVSISTLRKRFHRCTTHGINALRAVCPGTFTRDPKKEKDVMCFECILKTCKTKSRERVIMDVVLAPFKITVPRTSPATSPLSSPQTPAELEEELFGPNASLATGSSCSTK